MKNEDNKHAFGGAGLKDKLLVIGDDTSFSDMLMSYSLDMAERMDYSIIALNLRVPPRARKRHISPSVLRQNELKLRKSSEEGAGIFGEMARARRVGLERDARIGHLDSVIRRIYKERDDIDLVLLEPEYVNEEAEGPRSIPAFYLPYNDNGG